MNDPVKKDLPNFVAVKERYDKLTPGQKAELRRVAEPDDLSLVPALYTLLPGVKPGAQYRRLVFLLPWCGHRGGAKSLGAQLADAGVNEARVIQTARAGFPEDLKQLRRLAMHATPTLDWDAFGRSLWYWGDPAKRTLVEEYFLAKSNPTKGASK